MIPQSETEVIGFARILGVQIGAMKDILTLNTMR